MILKLNLLWTKIWDDPWSRIDLCNCVIKAHRAGSKRHHSFQILIQSMLNVTITAEVIHHSLWRVCPWTKQHYATTLCVRSWCSSTIDKHSSRMVIDSVILYKQHRKHIYLRQHFQIICKHVLGFVGISTICLYLDTNYDASFDCFSFIYIVFIYTFLLLT